MTTSEDVDVRKVAADAERNLARLIMELPLLVDVILTFEDG